MMVLPPTYQSIFQDPHFLYSTFYKEYCQVIKSGEAWGVRKKFGPLVLEYYTGDVLPEILPCSGLRLIIWRPHSLSIIPFKWRQTWFSTNSPLHGVINVQENYKEYWSSRLLGEERKFHRSAYEILSIPISEYQGLYKQYAIPPYQLHLNMTRHERYTAVSPDTIKCYVLSDKRTDEIVAGICVINCKSIQQSYYFSAFTCKNTAPKFAGIALISHWFHLTKESGLTFANLGAIWSKGNDDTWKGFSEFKMRFCPFLLKPQRELFRVTFKW